MILNATGKENSVWRLNFTDSGPPSEQVQKAHQPRGTVQAKADLPMRNGRNSGLQRTRCLWKCRRRQIRKRCFSLLDIRQLRSRSYYKGLFVLLRTCSQLWWREAGQNIQRNASVLPIDRLHKDCQELMNKMRSSTTWRSCAGPFLLCT